MSKFPLSGMVCVRYTVVLGLLSLCLMAGSASWAQQLPSRQAPVRATSSVPTTQLPAVDTEALRAEDAQQADEIGPYRYGTVIDTEITPDRHGRWERLPSGDWLWRIRIRSEGARSLSLAFSRFELPTGARLYVHDGDGSLVRGPYTAADATNGRHRTPIIRGQESLVELTVPDGQRSALSLELDRVVHGYRSLRPQSETDGAAKSGSCNLDVACDEADPWRNQVRSVGLYTFQDGGNSFLCTGSLVNNTNQNGRPFFLTAEHCISSPSHATSMVFYWNYQNATCRTQGSSQNGQVTGDNRSDQTSSGAILRARYGGTHDGGGISGKSDLTLVEVDDTIPQSYNLFFNGWSREGNGSAEASTVHHPSGDGKRISFDQDATTITDYLGSSNSGTTHLRVGNWEVGTTEGGSSGSPLYDEQQRVIGVLSGGYAGCNSGSAEDNDQPDWYGRIAPGFTKGDYTPSGEQAPTTLADWLDPTNSGVQTLDGYPQSDLPPTDSPDNLTASRSGGTVILNWTAPDSGGVAQYRVYRASGPIDWTPITQAVSPVFAQVPAGTTTMVDSQIVADTSYHYRVTAVDTTDYESSFSGEQSVSTDVPAVTVADGRDGRPYTPPSPQPGSDRNPIGRLQLTAGLQEATLSSLTIQNRGSSLTGVESFELWSSTDATFQADSDVRVASTSSGSPVTFSSLDRSIPSDGVFLFLVVDLSGQASGDYAPVLSNEQALSFSTGTLTTVNGTVTSTFTDAYLSTKATALPIELASFDAITNERTVVLDWTTQSETNNTGFGVQHRADSTADWETLGFVSSKAEGGTSSTSLSYRFETSPMRVGPHWFRLRQVDSDGTASVSPPIRTTLSLEEPYRMTTHPNPARGKATVEVTVKEKQTVRLRLYDVLGRRVATLYKGTLGAEEPKLLSLDPTQFNLSSGSYFLRLVGDSFSGTSRLTIVR